MTFYPVLGGPYDGKHWIRLPGEYVLYMCQRYRYEFRTDRWVFDKDLGHLTSVTKVQTIAKDYYRRRTR